nr:hemerythrin domain-containing protein [Neisseria meningitidis]
MEYLTTTIPTHFEIERTRLADVILTKLSDDKAVKLTKQMLDEHEYIESLLVNTDPSVDDVKELANALYDHIRFEERELFPIAETVLSDDELFAIYEASDENVK